MRNPENQAAAEELMRAGYSPLFARILSMRGVHDKATAESFLTPSLSQMHDPYLMHGMQDAVDAIRAAVQEGKRIVVFGDYDVDGVTATSVMLSQLRDMGADAGYYLPNRHGEGYGLSEKAVRSLAGSYDMLITVDCGITSIAEVAAAKEAGLCVIVTDHHEPLDTLPDCICVNPKLGYPCRDLCGAGVAGKVAQALGGIAALEKVIDLVAMGTIADIVPLLDENRVLAAEGLKKMNAGARPGIAALAEVSGLLGKKLTSGHISFSLAPRINAGGRIGHSGKSVDMMLSSDRPLVLATARELDSLNRERQRQEQDILAGALEQAQREDLRSARALVLAGETWNPGVIGIVATRIVERYHRPAFVLAKEGNFYVGSGRSVPGVHLFHALQSVSELFERFGGHEMAAGLTIREENLGAFRRGMQQWMEALPPELFLPTAVYDVEARIADIDISVVEQLGQLAPTGQGNPSPVLLVRDVFASGARTMGSDGSHLRFAASEGAVTSQIYAFRQGARLGEAQGPVDLLVNPEIDDYTGAKQVRLIGKNFSRAQRAFAAELKARGDELLVRSIDGLRAGGQEGGFRRHIVLKGEEHMRETLLSMLSQTVGGVLILCALPATAARMDEFLQASPCDPLVRRESGALPVDPAAPHTLLCPALAQGEGLAHYRQILLPDGVWHNGFVEALQSAAPDAVIYAPPVPDATREAVAALVPTIEDVRSLYKRLRSAAMRVKGARDFSSLLEMLGNEAQPAPSVQIGLMMLRDMELIRYDFMPFSLSLVDDVQGKRDMTATPTYRFFHTFSGGEA